MVGRGRMKEEGNRARGSQKEEKGRKQPFNSTSHTQAKKNRVRAGMNYSLIRESNHFSIDGASAVILTIA